MSRSRGGADAAGDVGGEHVADNFQDDVVENIDVEEAVVRALPSSHRPTPKEVDDHYVSHPIQELVSDLCWRQRQRRCAYEVQDQLWWDTHHRHGLQTVGHRHGRGRG